MTVRNFSLPAWPALAELDIGRSIERHPRAFDLALAAAAGLVVFAIYNATLTPSLSYISPDGNELATTAYTLGLAHPTGYPLYTWLGKLFTFLPVGDVAHRVNLMSAVGAAGACALLYGIVRELRCGRPVALFAALFFGFSTTLWAQATISEVYAPNLVFVALALYLILLWGRHQRDPLVRRHGDMRSTLLFSGWALTVAASAGTHMSSLGFLPGYGVYILLVNWRVVRQPLVLGPGLLLFGLGLMQFLWLPIRTVMGEPVPDPINPATLEGFIHYTVDAFPQFKWAYPLEVLPDRFMFYGMFVRANFGWPGIAAGLIGAGGLTVRRPRTFTLLALMWAVQVIFFIQYRAMDLDVFFIPAHFLLAIAVAYGAFLLVQGTQRLLRAVPAGAPLSAVLCAGLLILPVSAQLRHNFATHDQSDHTEINDFYKNVYRLLPQDSLLLGGSGVFGFDMFYYQYVYDLRPDVTLPSSGLSFAQRARFPSTDRPRYSVDPNNNLPARFGPGGNSGDWSVPVLVAPAHDNRGSFLRRDLVLYRVDSRAPSLIDDSSTPNIPLDATLGGSTLIGADVAPSRLVAGETVHVKLYWQMERVQSVAVTLAIGSGDEAVASTHQAGFGLFDRYDREVAPIRGHTLVEEFDFVVLASTPSGPQPLTVRLGGSGSHPVTITILDVE